MRADDYTDQLWRELVPARGQLRAEPTRLGPPVSMTLVGRTVDPGRRTYRYRIRYEDAIVLQEFVLDRHDRLVDIRSRQAELFTTARLK